MRGVILVLIAATSAAAEDKLQKLAERAPPPHIPKEHTATSSGIDRPVNHALPGVTRRNVLGYVNETTFGMDYTLFGRRPWLVSPGLWPSGRKPASYAKQYATEPRFHIPDVFALQPFRRAVKEAKAEKAGHGEPHAADAHGGEKPEKHDEKHGEEPHAPTKEKP